MRTDYALALWGVAGAFIYAAPRLSAAMLQARAADPPGSALWCLWEFAVALVTGAILASAATEGIAAFAHRDAPSEIRGMATVIGLCANRASSVIVEAVNGRLFKIIMGSKQ